MSQADLPLKGLLIDKGELLNPGATLLTLAKAMHANVEYKKIKLVESWRRLPECPFVLCKDTRPIGTTIRWQVRRRCHDLRFKGRYTHWFLYWKNPDDVAVIINLLKENPDKERILDLMQVYEIARRNLVQRAMILNSIIKGANDADYGWLQNLTPHHLSQAKELINTL